MAFKGFEDLPVSEQDDFTFACEKRKLSPDDFTVVLEESYPIEGFGHVRRIVHVAKLGRNEGQKYPAGYGTSWTMTFDQDLLTGKFN